MKRIDAEKVKFGKYKRGRYGSYGNRDIKTYQTKVPREIFDKFDEKRKLYHMCKNEILVGFLMYYNEVISIERKDLANNQKFIKNEDIKRKWEKYKLEKYNQHIHPLVTNGITTDLANGRSIGIKETLDQLFKGEL